MKKLLYIGTFVCLAMTTKAQIGKYEKVAEETETIELLENQRFEYTYKNEWTKSTTKGTWQLEGGQILLSSDIQRSHYTVVEKSCGELEQAVLKVVIGGAKKGQAPKNIRRVWVVQGTDTVTCVANNDDMLAEMDRRQQLQLRGTAAQQDSLRQTDNRRHYSGEWRNSSVQMIIIETDKYVINYKPTDTQARCFFFSTRWSEDGLYAYFDKTPFAIVDKKQLKAVQTGAVYKNIKK